MLARIFFNVMYFILYSIKASEPNDTEHLNCEDALSFKRKKLSIDNFYVPSALQSLNDHTDCVFLYADKIFFNDDFNDVKADEFFEMIRLYYKFETISDIKFEFRKSKGFGYELIINKVCCHLWESNYDVDYVNLSLLRVLTFSGDHEIKDSIELYKDQYLNVLIEKMGTTTFFDNLNNIYHHRFEKFIKKFDKRVYKFFDEFEDKAKRYFVQINSEQIKLKKNIAKKIILCYSPEEIDGTSDYDSEPNDDLDILSFLDYETEEQERNKSKFVENCMAEIKNKIEGNIKCLMHKYEEFCSDFKSKFTNLLKEYHSYLFITTGMINERFLETDGIESGPWKQESKIGKVIKFKNDCTGLLNPDEIYPNPTFSLLYIAHELIILHKELKSIEIECKCKYNEFERELRKTIVFQYLKNENSVLR